MSTKSPFSHLRPTTAPEMLDRSFYAALRFAPVLWLGGLVYASDHLTSIIIDQFPGIDPHNKFVVIGMLALALVGDFAAAIALLAMFQGLIFPLRPLSPKALLRTGLRKLPAYFLSHLLYMIVVITMGIISLGFFRGQAPAAENNARLISGIATGLAGLWIAIRLCLAPITCLIEDGNPFSSLRRSWQLTAHRRIQNERFADYPAVRWATIAILPVIVTLTIAAALGAYGYFQLGVRWPVSWQKPPASRLLDLLAFAATWLAMPLYWAGTMSLYVEYRMRREALDFYLRIRELTRPEKEGLSDPATDPSR